MFSENWFLDLAICLVRNENKNSPIIVDFCQRWSSTFAGEEQLRTLLSMGPGTTSRDGSLCFLEIGIWGDGYQRYEMESAVCWRWVFDGMGQRWKSESLGLDSERVEIWEEWVFVEIGKKRVSVC